MKKRCIVLLVLISMEGNSQVVLSATSALQLLDFSANMPATAGTLPGTVFTSAGFEPDAIVAGRLNSNAWSFSGWSDGSLLFGGSRVAAATDYTRGSATNAVSTGGIYAFTGSPGTASNPMLLLQPGGADWAPGTMTLKIKNGSAVIIQSLMVQYDLYVRNDQGRSSSFMFSHSANDINYFVVPSLDYVSPAAPDAAGLVHIGAVPSRNLTISGLAITPGSYYYLRWNSEDISGSGARDEFGIDNILISADFAQSPLPVSLLNFRAQPLPENNLISWRTVFEQNNRGFELQRSEDGIDFQMLNFIPTCAVLGNSQEEINYSFIDKQVQNRSWYYRLKQIDEDGRTYMSRVVACRRNNDLCFHLFTSYPNPVIDEFDLVINTFRPEICFIIVLDIVGHKIIENEKALNAGMNKVKMNAANWPEGYYRIFLFSRGGFCLGKTSLIRV